MSAWSERGNVVNWKGPFPRGPLVEPWHLAHKNWERAQRAERRAFWIDLSWRILGAIAVVAVVLFFYLGLQPENL